MDIDGSDKRRIAEGFDRDIDRLEWTPRRPVRRLSGGRRLPRRAYRAFGRGCSPTGAEISDTYYSRPYAGGQWSVSQGRYARLYQRHGPAPGGHRDAARRRGDPADLAQRSEAFGQAARANDRARRDARRWNPHTDLAGRVRPIYVEGTRIPTILEIHGGPYAAYGPHFSSDYQIYASAGYATLFHQSGRLDRLRTSLRRPDRGELPDFQPRRADGRRRCGNRGRLCRSGQSVRHRRFGRRHPDRVDRGADRPLRRSRILQAGHQLDQHGADERWLRLLRPLLDEGSAVGAPRRLLAPVPASGGPRTSLRPRW